MLSIPLGATYHRENVDSELDLCMVDSNDIVREFQKSEAPFSDGHDMITVTNASSLTPLPPRDFTYRDFKDVDEKALCDYLASCNWTAFNSSCWYTSPIVYA